jgi:iron complex outermembrane receptor protein
MHDFQFRWLVKQAILPVLLLLSMITARAQSFNGSLHGRVTDVQGKVLPDINIRLENRNERFSSNATGHFNIPQIKPGKYVIFLSGIGYKRLQQTITIEAGKVRELVFMLSADEFGLQQVEILGRKGSSYKSDYTFGATKTATYLKDVPQAVSIVTKELIADRQMEKAWEVTKMMSGVNRYSNYNDLVIRGFRTGENQPRLINGLRAAFGYFDQPVTANLERVEVIKGPASALFGNAVPGGTINFVTKKPLAEKRSSLTFSGGSFNTIRAAADVTGPLVNDSTILFRVNAAYSNAESFRSLQFSENVMLAPSFSFIPSEKTSINVDLVFSQNNSRIDRGQPVFGASAAGDIFATPISLAIAAPNDFYKVRNLQLNAGLTHDFSENLSFNLSYMKFGWDEKLLEHRTSNVFAVDGQGQEVPSKVAMQVFDRLQKISSDNINGFFRQRIFHGIFKHTLLLGYDHIQQIRPEGSSQNVARGYRNAGNDGVISSFDPANSQTYLLDEAGNPVPNVAHFDLNNVQYPIRNTDKYLFSPTVFAPSKYTINAIYLQDQIAFKKWQVLLGLRQEFYTDFTNHNLQSESKVTQQALIPRVGLIHSLTPTINLYGTYTAGYLPQSPSTFTNPNNGGPFDPSTSNMIEAGAKGSFFNDKLALNLSVYQIRQNNVLVNANDPVNPDLLRQRGAEQSRGFELEAVGNILSNLSINANYAYNEAVVTRGLPAEAGLQKANAPKHLANVWLKYSFIQGKLSGLGFGGGMNYSARRNTELFSLQLPSYTTVDMAAYYTMNKLRFGMNMNNILDKKHWIAGYNYTRIFPGSPRNMMFSITKLF